MTALNLARLSLGAIALLVGASAVHAQTTANTTSAVHAQTTANTTFTVTLTLTPTCTISATNMDFGTQGVLAAQLTATSAITTTCTNTTPYNIWLNAGSVTGSSVAQRLLAGTAAGNTGTTVNFNLYQTAAPTAPIWGNTVGTDTVSGVGTGSAVETTVYGRVPAQTTPAPGAYQYTITATITY